MKQETLKEIVIRAFNEGSDRFGEIPSGEIGEIEYITTSGQYLVRVLLSPAGSTGVGLKKTIANRYDVISGHVVFSVPVTEELEAELSKAIYTEV